MSIAALRSVNAGRLRFGAWRLARVPVRLTTAGSLTYETRFRIHTGAQSVAGGRLVFPTYRLQDGYFAAPNAFTLSCAIENAGVSEPVTFAGQSSRLVNPSEGLVLSDHIANLPANTTRWVRCCVQVASNETLPVAGISRWPSDGSVNQTVRHSGAPQVFGTGALTGTHDANGGYGPIALVGAQSGLSCLVFGDSIVDNFDDIGDGSGNFGWIARALASAGVPHTRAHRGGNRVVWSTPDVVPVQFDLCRFASHVVVNLSRNDIAAQDTATRIKNGLLAIFAKCKEHRCKVYAALVCPGTTSTDAWATETNQTFSAAFAPGGVRDQINSWLMDRAADATIDGIVNPLPYVESLTNPGKWLAGTTVDGVHPGAANGVLHGSMSQAMLDVIATW